MFGFIKDPVVFILRGIFSLSEKISGWVYKIASIWNVSNWKTSMWVGTWQKYPDLIRVYLFWFRRVYAVRTRCFVLLLLSTRATRLNNVNRSPDVTTLHRYSTRDRKIYILYAPMLAIQSSTIDSITLIHCESNFIFGK